MTSELPQYCLRAYALLYSKHGSREKFKQNELDWIVSQSMRKKIFSLLLKKGWILKESRNSYTCVEPNDAIKGLLEFKVQGIIKKAKKEYAFTNLSAIEIWSDYAYVLRSFEKSPYFIKVAKKDLPYWRDFFNKNDISYYINNGSTIGEYVILMPMDKVSFNEKDDLKVDSLKETMRIAKHNEIYAYAYNYMRKKYAST